MENSSVPREQVARFYERHHSGKRKYDHVFGDDERRDTLIHFVGRGGRVLDIGCRSGSLTKYYIEGNDVVGVDVDRARGDSARAHADRTARRIGSERDQAPQPMALPDRDTSRGPDSPAHVLA